MILRRLTVGIPALLVVLLALVGPLLGTGTTTAPVAVPFQGPTSEEFLGTDVLGRDVLTRVLAGGRTLVIQAIAATVLGSILGLLLGIWSALTHRTAAAGIVLRIVDAVAAIPALLLLLLLAAGFPGNDAVVALAIAVVSVPFSVRVNRERASALAATDFAREAQARGDRLRSRIRYDIVPGLAPVAWAEAGIRFVAATQIAATAAFLGLGAGAPAANWGRMVRENSDGLTMNPLAVLVPAALLVILAIGVTAMIDQISDSRSHLTRIEQLT